MKMDDDIIEPYKNRHVWLRGLYMLIFMLLLGLVKFVALAV